MKRFETFSVSHTADGGAVIVLDKEEKGFMVELLEFMSDDDEINVVRLLQVLRSERGA